MSWLPSIRRAVLFLVSIRTLSALLGAQEPLPSVELETVPARLQELDRQFEEKVAAMRQAIDAEEAARRISEALAANLRWTLRASALVGTTINLRELISTLRIPPENAKLAAAATALDAAFNATQKPRALLFTASLTEIRKRYESALIQARTQEEALAAKKVFESAALPPDFAPTDGRSSQYQSYCHDAIFGLGALAETFQAVQNKDAEQIRRTFTTLTTVVQIGLGARPLSDAVQDRIGKLSTPSIESFENAEKEFVTALVSKEPEAELNAKFDRMSQSEATATVLSPAHFQTIRPRSDIYRLIQIAVAAANGGEAARAREALQSATAAVQLLNGAPAGRLRELLTAMQRNLDALAAAAEKAKAAEFRARLAAAASPADLNALAVDMRGAVSHRGGQQGENWLEPAAELMTLAARWAGGSLAGHESRGNYAGLLAPELNVLRQRVERDVVTRSLRVPELSQASLASLPLEEALDKFCDELAAKQEWRRLYEVLSLRPQTVSQRDGFVGQEDTLMSLRSFLAAQNFELAEQWPQAVSAYLAVLQTVSRRAPVQAAADRLKVIAKEHPAAMPTPGGTDPRLPRSLK